MKIAVTGANGYIGKHVVKDLTENNHEVIGITQKGRPQRPAQNIAQDMPDYDTIEINVGVSNRHVHLSHEVRAALFGAGYNLTYFKGLSQKGYFAAKETVSIASGKGIIENVRIIGPERDRTQIEISRTDMYKLGVDAPVRESGNLEGSPGAALIGPQGTVELSSGVICAKRHIHMSPGEAARFGLKNGDRVNVKAVTERGLIFESVLIRVHESFVQEFHLDTDEANAAGLNNGDRVIIIP